MMMLIFVFALFSVASSQISPACENDMSGTLNATLLFGQAISNASYVCSHSSPQACDSAVATITSSLQQLSSQLLQLSKDCFGANVSPQCSSRLSVISNDVSLVENDATLSAQDCSGAGPISQACLGDLENLGADVMHLVVDLGTAIAVCSRGGGGGGGHVLKSKLSLIQRILMK